MNQPEPLTDQQLLKADLDHGIYRTSHGHPGGFACCTAHAAADHVPTLLAEVRRQRTGLERRTEDVAFLERTTLPELRRTIQHHEDGKARWRGRAETAEATLERVCKVASRLAAHAVGFGDVLDDSDRGPWGRTVGADIAELSAAVAASAPPAAPLSAPQGSSVSEVAPKPAETAEGRLGDSEEAETEEPGWCTFGEGDAPGAGCILPAGHEPPNRHVVTPGDTDDDA